MLNCRLLSDCLPFVSLSSYYTTIGVVVFCVFFFVDGHELNERPQHRSFAGSLARSLSNIIQEWLMDKQGTILKGDVPSKSNNRDSDSDVLGWHGIVPKSSNGVRKWSVVLYFDSSSPHQFPSIPLARRL